MIEKRRMSVGFADLTHYTRMVERLGSEAALELLQESFNAAGDAIVRNGGRIWKYIGDGILFSFDDARSAAAAAAEIASGFRRELGPLLLRYRVGIATGEVLVTEIGHASLRAMDIMGETVNRAALLLREAGRTETGYVLDEETRRLCDNS